MRKENTDTIEGIKIDYLQVAMEKIESSMNKGFSRVHQRLDEIDNKIDSAYLIVTKHDEKINALYKEVDKIEEARKWRFGAYIGVAGLFAAFIYFLINLYK